MTCKNRASFEKSFIVFFWQLPRHTENAVRLLPKNGMYIGSQ
jgi:hypothetical protein